MHRNISSALAALLLLTAGTAQAASTITELGRHPFHQPPLRSPEDIRAMLQARGHDVSEGLDRAGSAEIAKLLEQQFPLADIKAKQYKPGTRFRWMFFRRGGKGGVNVARDLTWGGKTALDGYEFQLDDKGRCLRHTFAVPKICGNLALLKTEQITPCPQQDCVDCPKECPAECRFHPDDPEQCPKECKSCKPDCLPEFTCHDFPLDCPVTCLLASDDPEKCPAECKGVPEDCIVICPDEDCPPVTCADCPPECARQPDYCPDECKLLDCPASPPK